MKKYNGKELYKGLLFIKSMMSMNNVNRQKELDVYKRQVREGAQRRNMVRILCER